MKVTTQYSMIGLALLSGLVSMPALAQQSKLPYQYCLLKNAQNQSVAVAYGQLHKKSKPLRFVLNGKNYPAHFSAVNGKSFVWTALKKSVQTAKMGIAYGSSTPLALHNVTIESSCPQGIQSYFDNQSARRTLPVVSLIEEAPQYQQGLTITQRDQTITAPGHGQDSVTTGYYYFGNQVVSLPGTYYDNVEALAQFYYPSNLSQGPYPVIIFQHGMHNTCYTPAASGDKAASTSGWPCSSTERILPSFEGYAYVGKVLASLGFVVVSISANGVNAQDGYQPAGMLARAELIAQHLQYLQQFNTGKGEYAKYGAQFVGKLDLQNVGLIGHSRGGEGVVFAYNYLKKNDPQFKVNAVFSVAPTNDFRHYVNNVAYGTLFGYCDGDVDSLDGTHYFDNVDPGNPAIAGDPGQLDNTADKHMALVMGANHNYFNSVWGAPAYGGFDDWLTDDFDAAVLKNDPACGVGNGAPRLSYANQENMAISYLVPFFKTYLLGDSSAKPGLITGETGLPQPGVLHASYQPATSQKLNVNRLWNAENLSTSNALGDSVMVKAKNSLRCGQQINPASPINPVECVPISPGSQKSNYAIDATQQPHTFVTPSFMNSTKDYSLTQLYSDGFNEWVNSIPSNHANFSAYQYLQFRVSVGLATNAVDVPAQPQLTVTLTDQENHTATVKVNSKTTYLPPGDAVNRSPVPKMVLNMVRIPLSDFSGNDFDLQAVKQIAINSSVTTKLSLTDLMLVK